MTDNIYKELILLLKKNKSFTEFIRIKHLNDSTGIKLSLISHRPMLVHTFFEYFKKYLENNKLLSTFLIEHEKQNRKKFYKEDISEYINLNLTWANTAQGREFWGKEDNNWRTHIKELLGNGKANFNRIKTN
jgi:hypothetical protein